MAYRTATNYLKMLPLSKSEIILRRIQKYDNSKILQEYKSNLKNLKILNKYDARGLVHLPFTSFGIYPKDIYEKMMNEAVDTIKRKQMVNNHTYESIIKSYMDNAITFDMNHILKDMQDIKIEFSYNICDLLINYYCKRGEMENVEKLLDMVKLNNYKMGRTEKFSLITGYIIAGQMEKSLKCIEQYDFDKNSPMVLLSIAKGYASIGDTSRVLEIVNRLKEMDLRICQKYCFELYRMLVIANVPDSDLEPIFDIIIASRHKTLFYPTIFYLNRAGFYNISLKLVQNYKMGLRYPKQISDIVTSFNSSDCPINVYKSILELFIDDLDAHFQRNVFSNLNYDDAYELAQSLINNTNSSIIFISLMNKAIGDKSILSIQNTLEFGFEHLKPIDFDFSLHFGFIPSMLQSGMASSFKEILDLLPLYRSVLLPVILMHNLCKGQFLEYNNLIVYHDSPIHLPYFMNLKSATTMIMKHVSFKEVETLIVEASKVFHTSLVNKLLSSYLTQKIISSSNQDAIEDLNNALKMTEDFNVTFTEIEFELIKSKAVNHLNLLQSLSQRIEKSS